MRWTLLLIGVLLLIPSTLALTNVYTNSTQQTGSAWATTYPYNNFNNAGASPTYSYLEHNITIQAASAAAGSSFKAYWDSTSGSAGGEDVYLEWQTTDYSIKYEPGYDRTISGVAAGTFTINIRVNYTADTFVMCLNGASCQSSRAYTDDGNGYMAFAWGADGPKVNVTKYTVDALDSEIPSTSSCTWSGSGNWTILKSDNCNITTNVDLLNNTLFFNGSGSGATIINAQITNVSQIRWSDTPVVYLWWRALIKRLT